MSNGIQERIEIVMNNLEDNIYIYIEIVVGNNISNSHHLFPIDRRIGCQSLFVRNSVEIFDAFPDDKEHHTSGIEFLCTSRSERKVICTSDDACAFLKGCDSFFNLGKNVQNKFTIWNILVVCF